MNREPGVLREVICSCLARSAEEGERKTLRRKDPLPGVPAPSPFRDYRPERDAKGDETPRPRGEGVTSTEDPARLPPLTEEKGRGSFPALSRIREAAGPWCHPRLHQTAACDSTAPPPCPGSFPARSRVTVTRQTGRSVIRDRKGARHALRMPGVPFLARSPRPRAYRSRRVRPCPVERTHYERSSFGQFTHPNTSPCSGPRSAEVDAFITAPRTTLSRP